uniref:Uncharacterized protein n=1 Tax=Glossina austeni TaxID=7395 RepID=A0A1A9VM53_GLOAU
MKKNITTNEINSNIRLILELRVSPSVFIAPQAYAPALSRSNCVKCNISLLSPDIRIPYIRMYLYLHATRITRLSSTMLPENQGFDERHVSSALLFSDVTFKVFLFRQITQSFYFTSLSLCEVISAFRIGSPSRSQVIFAAGYDPHDSQRNGVGCPASSLMYYSTLFVPIFLKYVKSVLNLHQTLIFAFC